MVADSRHIVDDAGRVVGDGQPVDVVALSRAGAGADVGEAASAEGSPISDKSRLAAAILCWFLGVLGIHRFYVGKIGTGILMLITLGGFGIWALIDFIMILIGSFRDKENKLILNWQ